MTPAETGPDPWEAVEQALNACDVAKGPEPRRAALESALAEVHRLEMAGVPSDARARAYKAEILRRLGRLSDAARELRGVVEVRIDDGEVVLVGLADLLDGVCGYEEMLALEPLLAERLSGRRWQWEPFLDEARLRLRLEREAPITREDLVRLREEVGRRVASAGGCRHDDERRPFTAAAAIALGLDPARLLPWLSDARACCCDCQVVLLLWPREARSRRVGG